MSTWIVSFYGRVLRLLQKVNWAGPLLVRLTLGLFFATNGWIKLKNHDTITQNFESWHIPWPAFNATFVGCVEFGGGLLLIVGLGTRIASALLIGVMAVAIWTAKLPELHEVLDLSGMDEFPYLATFVWLLVSGAGAVSIDHLIARRARAEPRAGVAA